MIHPRDPLPYQWPTYLHVVTPPTLPLKIHNQAIAIEYVPRFFSATYMTYLRVDFLSDIIISLYEIGVLGYP